LLHKKEQTNIYLFDSNQEHEHISQKGSSSNQSNQNEFEIWNLRNEFEQTSLKSKLERRSMQSAKNRTSNLVLTNINNLKEAYVKLRAIKASMNSKASLQRTQKFFEIMAELPQTRLRETNDQELLISSATQDLR
jgi:hypothetical protein